MNLLYIKNGRLMTCDLIGDHLGIFFFLKSLGEKKNYIFFLTFIKLNTVVTLSRYKYTHKCNIYITVSLTFIPFFQLYIYGVYREYKEICLNRTSFGSTVVFVINR